MSFIDKIRWQCRISGPMPALSLPGVLVTYGELLNHLDAVLAKSLEAGASAGKVYGLLIDNPLLSITLTLCLEDIGAATLGLNSEKQAENLPLAGIFTDRDIGACAKPLHRVHENWLYALGGKPSSFQRPKRNADDMCRVTLTS